MSRMSWWATCFKRVSGDDDHDNAVKNYDDSDYNDDDNDDDDDDWDNEKQLVRSDSWEVFTLPWAITARW